MILLDTNVVSEAMTREPHPRVREWLDARHPCACAASLALTPA